MKRVRDDKFAPQQPGHYIKEDGYQFECKVPPFTFLSRKTPPYCIHLPAGAPITFPLSYVPAGFTEFSVRPNTQTSNISIEDENLTAEDSVTPHESQISDPPAYLNVIKGNIVKPPGFNRLDSISETMNLIARNLVMPLANGFFHAPGERFYLTAGKNKQPKLFLPIYETPERLYLSAGDSMTQPESNNSEAKEDCVDFPVGGSIREDEAPANCIYLPPGDPVKSAKPRPGEPVKSSKPLPYSKLSHEDDNSNSSDE
ncbi:hypothetical protein J6590_084450 [Homalodisca vitripennis]|nr:hypothetical protein J6590_084450 [Homalodisca vitripennis]